MTRTYTATEKWLIGLRDSIADELQEASWDMERQDALDRAVTALDRAGSLPVETARQDAVLGELVLAIKRGQVVSGTPYGRDLLQAIYGEFSSSGGSSV